MALRDSGSAMKFFRDFTVLAGGQIVSKLLGFLAFAWLARALDPVHYGAVEYIIGLAGMFTMVVEGGLDVVGTRRVAHRPTDLAPLAFQVFVARLLFALVCVPSFVIATTVTVHDTIPHGLVWLYALSLLAIPWRQLWLFQATGRMSVIANAEIIRMTVFSAIVWLAVRRSEDVLMVGWAEIAAVTTMALFYLILQHRNIVPVRFTGSIAGFGLLLREGVTVGSTSLVWALCQFTPLFLVASLVGGVETAWFAGAARITGSLVQFSNIYHFNLYPVVSRAHAQADGALGHMLKRSLRVTAWGGTFVALVLTVFAVPLVRLTLGPKLVDAAPLLQILAWTIPIALWSGHSRWALAAAGAQTRVLASQIAGLVATLVSCLVLGKMFDGPGYAAGSLLGALTVWLVAHQFARRRHCAPPPFYLILRPLALAGAIILCVGYFALPLWQAVLAVGAYALAAPLLDRALLKDLAQLSV